MESDTTPLFKPAVCTLSGPNMLSKPPASEVLIVLVAGGLVTAAKFFIALVMASGLPDAKAVAMVTAAPATRVSGLLVRLPSCEIAAP